MFEGSLSSISMKPYIFVMYQEGGGGPNLLSPSGSADDLQLDFVLLCRLVWALAAHRWNKNQIHVANTYWPI